MTDQLSMLPDLDRASDTREANLCRTWKNAQENDRGVLTINSYEFVAKDGKKISPRVAIECAMVYPKVYYAFSVDTSTSGQGSPVCKDYSHNFDVHECAPNVMLMVEQNLRRITDRYHIKDSVVNNALEQMRKSITSTEAEERHLICDHWEQAKEGVKGEFIDGFRIYSAKNGENSVTVKMGRLGFNVSYDFSFCFGCTGYESTLTSESSFFCREIGSIRAIMKIQESFGKFLDDFEYLTKNENRGKKKLVLIFRTLLDKIKQDMEG